MNHVNRFNKITQTATTVAKSWTNHEIVMFHYFNPNGLIAAKKVTDKQIDALVDSGLAKNGAIMAYGSLNYFHTDKLQKLFNKKAVNGIDLHITLEGIRRNIEKANEFIAEQTK